MAMTDEDKKKMLAVFLEDTKKAEADEYDPDTDPWTEDALREVAHKIMRRMGLDDKQLL